MFLRVDIGGAGFDFALPLVSHAQSMLNLLTSSRKFSGSRATANKQAGLLIAPSKLLVPACHIVFPIFWVFVKFCFSHEYFKTFIQNSVSLVRDSSC